MKKIKATEKSLSIAERVAESLNLPFDKEQTRLDAMNLLDIYYQDICKVLPEETKNLRFDNFATHVVEAFSGFTIEKKPVIFFDQHLTLIFLGLFHILCIQTCHVLEENEQESLKSLFNETLQSLLNPKLHLTSRKKALPLLTRYSEALMLANTLTSTLTAFIICHEIAHHNLGHLNNNKARIEDELDADKMAFQFLVEISHQCDNLSHLKISTNKLSAPLFGFAFLNLLEQNELLDIQDSSHPSASIRIKNLTDIFYTSTDPNGIYLYEGLQKGLEDFNKL